MWRWMLGGGLGGWGCCGWDDLGMRGGGFWEGVVVLFGEVWVLFGGGWVFGRDLCREEVGG